MIPKYPFVVRIRRRTGAPEGHGRTQTDHSYETMGAACTRANEALKERLVTSVQVMVILDVLSKSPDNGFDNH